MYTCEKCGKPNRCVDYEHSPLITEWIEVCDDCMTAVKVFNNYGYEWAWIVNDIEYVEEFRSMPTISTF